MILFEGESIQKHLAAKDAKSANSKNHLDSLRYSRHKAFKLTVNMNTFTASKAQEHHQDNTKCQASCLLL